MAYGLTDEQTERVLTMPPGEDEGFVKEALGCGDDEACFVISRLHGGPGGDLRIVETEEGEVHGRAKDAH